MSSVSISERIVILRQRIQAARLKSDRAVDTVQLLAVSKTQPVEKILEAARAGQLDFGENYAQELIAKAEQGGSQIRWHFIGHLQRNKVKQLLPHVTLIHSVDSFTLAQEIDKRATALGKIQPVLIEVNSGGEASKSGVALSEKKLENLVRSLNTLSHVDLRGLMTIPPPKENPEEVRPFFRQLREIRDALNREKVYKHSLQELSMGMTHDFEVAIEEGATIVRVGTGIFGAKK